MPISAPDGPSQDDFGDAARSHAEAGAAGGSPLLADGQPPVGSAPSVVDADTFSSAELQRLTGVSSERIRTWERRFGFPVSLTDHLGRRRFLATDVPRVLAVSQLIAAGEPVADAVRQVQEGGGPDWDLASLQATFGAIDVPVVALGGPEPLEVVWANAAALDSAEAELGDGPWPVTTPNRALQRLLVQDETAGGRVTHLPWFDADPGAEPVAALAWHVGGPAFVPGIALVVDLPAGTAHELPAADAPPAQEPSRSPDQIDNVWAGAISGARRALQRSIGRVAVEDAVTALVTGGPATDGFLLLRRGEELRAGRSARGELVAGPISERTRRALEVATLDATATLDPQTCADLRIADGSHAVAAPLLAAHVQYGFLVLVFDDTPELTVDSEELLFSLATAIAATVSRDRALLLRRQLEEG